MAHSPAHGRSAGGHGHEQHGSLSTYVSVFVALLILTAISFAVGNWGAMKEKAPGVLWVTMMAVSVAKALLVILFFMHLKWEANWKYVLTVPCCIMSIFLVLMLVPDIGRRTLHYAEERWRYSTEQSLHVYENALGHTTDATLTHDVHGEKTGH